ncbi:Uncharacterized conserved protein, DUF58 family, contains vWF domain [Thermomonospora echinospora]|uniref:Uncharacterized conserved protein, DUF58 family, contains vWF domain n=1 Tax=Thermomonospora echinospora TaxID=1992 RepID=A0A1H5X1S2_9ACTN|nr:DUF58 domain-containing protein [Thermomonospora echinospora]SEG05688.1 Uncharacterized conserved protein, DUF58 family, contains vWF domain [Thermomonospora echinospora]
MGSVLLYAAGWWLGYPEPAALGLTGLVAVLLAVIWTSPRPGLKVGREIAPTKVERGEAAIGVLHITGEGRSGRGGLVAHDTAGAATVTVDIPRLRPGATRTVTYRLPTGRRGEMPVGPLRLVRSDPLRLARRVREYGTQGTLLVRPRTVALAPLPSGRAHHLEGPASDRAPAGTATFHSLREYVRGDEMRHVHWKSTARTGTLMVRRFVDAGLPVTTVVVESRPDSWPDPDDFELAVDAAASVAVGACRAGFPVRILAGTATVAETRGGPGDAEVVLDRLTGAAPAAGAWSAPDVARRVRPGGSLVVITPGEPDLGGIAAVRARFDRVWVLRVRPRGAAAVPPGVTVVDFGDLDDLTAAWRREIGRPRQGTGGARPV